MWSFTKPKNPGLAVSTFKASVPPLPPPPNPSHPFRILTLHCQALDPESNEVLLRQACRTIDEPHNHTCRQPWEQSICTCPILLKTWQDGHNHSWYFCVHGSQVVSLRGNQQMWPTCSRKGPSRTGAESFVTIGVHEGLQLAVSFTFAISLVYSHLPSDARSF